MPWIVKAELPKIHHFREGFFPRVIWYKADALILAKEVEKVGGKATIEKIKRWTSYERD